MIIRLELLVDDVGAHAPITGTVAGPIGAARPFTGYAELVSELEVLRRPAVPVRTDPEPRPEVPT